MSRPRLLLHLAGITLALLVTPLPARAQRDASPPRDTPLEADFSEPSDPTARALRGLLAAGRIEGLRQPRLADVGTVLEHVYAPRRYAPLWLDAGGRPGPAARDAVAALRGAHAKGLDPRDYDAAQLAGWLARSAGDRASASERARLDVALSAGVARLLSDLRLGRVDPRALHFGYEVEPKRLDLAAVLADAVRRDRVAAAVAEAEPGYAQNRLLQEQLARYRELASDPSLEPVPMRGTFRRGDALVAAPALARWLEALGDLPPGAWPPPAPALPGGEPSPDVEAAPVYDGPLVDAVLRFQHRHGLATDGVIGPHTARELAVSAAARARQIELALERLRWLPAIEGGRAVFVNVPAFELVALDRAGSGDVPALEMAVVVGRAARTETPVFAAPMQQVVFSPYWNVPRSIAVGELLPKERRRPGHIARQRMEVVSDGRVLAPTGAALDLVARGAARLRQRPGPSNSLGRVKFLFPNPYSVYLHDTPSVSLFARSRRDFSHGCIRVAEPAQLALWVLGPQGWDEGAVTQALARTSTKVVRIDAPFPVVIYYATAVARRDGTIAFYADIYGHDVALERVLARGPPYRP